VKKKDQPTAKESVWPGGGGKREKAGANGKRPKSAQKPKNIQKMEGFCRRGGGNKNGPVQQTRQKRGRGSTRYEKKTKEGGEKGREKKGIPSWNRMKKKSRCRGKRKPRKKKVAKKKRRTGGGRESRGICGTNVGEKKERVREKKTAHKGGAGTAVGVY